MMKKLRLLIACTIAINFGANAQTVSTPTVITDTLHYYLNKYYFKTNTTDIKLFPYFKSPAATVATATRVTHMGSRFDVPDTVIVTGLEGWVSRGPSTISQTIKVHLFLCSLDGNKMPILPPIDSIVSQVGFSSVANPTIIGGNFTATVGGSVVPASHTLTSDFAVLVRNMSTIEGDTIKVFRTAGKTFTNALALPEEKCSDGGYSYVRFNGDFYRTTDYNINPGFGVGTDYEFMLAPRVKYNLYAGQNPPAQVTNSDVICAHTQLTFQNISSPFYMHRQYNLLEFYRKWNLHAPFPGTPPGGWTADSSITWFFEFNDNLTPPMDPRMFLKQNETSVTVESGEKGCFTSNSFRARLRLMMAFGTGPTNYYNEDFTVCWKFCNGDTTGIAYYDPLEHLQVYPNPAVSGKATVTGLTGKNMISVYNMLGQEVIKITTDAPTAVIDLNAQPKGIYIVRIKDSADRQKMVKLVHQN